MDILTGENLTLETWSVRSSSKRGMDVEKGLGWLNKNRQGLRVMAMDNK